MSATLPPGWTGTDRVHVFDIETTICLFVARVCVLGDDSAWTWQVYTDSENGESVRGKEPTAPEARAAALLALQTLLTTAVAEVNAALANLTNTEPA